MKQHLNSFVLADPQKCTGCRVCEIACAVAHSEHDHKTVGTMDQPLIPRLYLVQTDQSTMPVQCRHCEDAPCLRSCPVSIFSREENQISANEEYCIGCKSCLLACPFGAIELGGSSQNNPMHRVIANKCDLCSGHASGPACVASCPSQALRIVDWADERKRKQIAAANQAGAVIKQFRSMGEE